MRSILPYLPLLLGALTWGNASATVTVTIEADASYPPYSFIERDEMRGIYIDLLQQAAHRLKPDYEVRFQPVSWNRGLLNLESGKSLALVPPYKTDQRQTFARFSTPLLRESIVLFCRPGLGLPALARFPDDFRGLTIGVNRGFSQGENMVRFFAQGLARKSEANSNEANLRMLAAGRVDCYASDRLAAHYTARQMRKTAPDLVPVLQESAEVSGEMAYIGYSTLHPFPEKAEFIRKMDAAIEAVKAEGELRRIIGRYTD